MEGKGKGRVKGGVIIDCRTCRCCHDGKAKEARTHEDVAGSPRHVAMAC